MLKKLSIALSLTISALSVCAEPYINTSNLALKASLYNLSATGQLNVPLTTYPLMWSDVNNALNKIDVLTLSEGSRKAYYHVKREFAQAKRKSITVSANAASKDNRFTSFGDSFRQKNNLTVAVSAVSDNFAFKVSPSITTNPLEGNHYQFNDSYVAARLGNWNVSLGTQDRWWGPGWDTNMGLTNNARPMPALALSRTNSTPLEIPFTDYEIPWNVTSFMGQMEEDRHIPNTLLWGFRLNLIPFENFEFALIRLAQWGGDGRSKSLGTFWDLFLGKDNCGAAGSNNIDCGVNKENEPGNQSAGFDLRYTVNVFDIPMGIYGQYFGEDGNADGGLNFVTKPMKQLGVDTAFNAFGQNINVFYEYSDTYQQCPNAVNTGDCIYEHHIYKTGMRYKKRSLGNLYDNDSVSYVLGIIGQNHQGLAWDAKLKRLDLNYDNSDRYPNNELGNSVTEIAEEMYIVSMNIKKQIGSFSYKVGLSHSESSFVDLPDDSETNIYFELTKKL